MAKNPTPLDKSKDTVLPQAPPVASYRNDPPRPGTVFGRPLASIAEVESYDHRQLLDFLQPLLDRWPEREKNSFSDAGLSGLALLCLGDGSDLNEFRITLNLGLSQGIELRGLALLILGGRSLGEKSNGSLLSPSLGWCCVGELFIYLHK